MIKFNLRAASTWENTGSGPFLCLSGTPPSIVLPHMAGWPTAQFFQPWKSHSGAQVLPRLCDALVAFMCKLDHLLPQRAGNHYSCTSDYQSFYDGQLCENWGPRTLFFCAVNFIAIASFKADSSVPECVFSSCSCQVTASGTDDFRIAVISFSNSSSLSLNSACFLLAWLSCTACGSG